MTSPMAVARTSQRSHTSCSSASLPGSTTHSIRSWDSETMISNGSMSSSRSGTFDTSMSSPTSPLDAISDEEDESPAAPRSWSERERAALQQLEAALQQPLLLERVADLHRRPLGGVVLVELGRREHRRPADAVAARARAHQHEQVAHPGRRAADQPVLARDAQAHRVHQAVLLVGALEVDLAAHRRHADRVAVVADARRPRRRAGSASGRSPARRSAASRARRSAARRPRTRRAGSRRRPWPRPGRAQPRSGGCATRP